MRELIDRLLGKSMEAYRKEIGRRNLEVTDQFLLFGMILSVMILTVQVFVRRTAIIYTNVIMFVYFFVLLVLRRMTAHRVHIDGTVMMYLIQIPMVIFSILMGTVWDPGREAFTILVLLASFPLCILDKPYRILLYIICSSVSFLVIDHMIKTPELFQTDINHMISSTLVSIAASMFVLRDRMESLRNYIAVRDISQTDALTGIWNRSHGQDLIQDMLDSEEGGGACIMIDVDEFKRINDRWGHMVGDDVLRHVAQILKEQFAEGIVCRYGGDEFAVYTRFTRGEEVRAAVLQAQQRLEKKSGWKHLPVRIRFSTGCVIHNGSCESVFRLISEADKQLYYVKNNCKGDIRIRILDSDDPKSE
ncbi:MAG: GGDEF domain-containing protein [Solobacterium sp.]|nr:GGDEF domain-containing protein [Solobacterium sp.]